MISRIIQQRSLVQKRFFRQRHLPQMHLFHFVVRHGGTAQVKPTLTSDPAMEDPFSRRKLICVFLASNDKRASVMENHRGMTRITASPRLPVTPVLDPHILCRPEEIDLSSSTDCRSLLLTKISSQRSQAVSCWIYTFGRIALQACHSSHLMLLRVSWPGQSVMTSTSTRRGSVRLSLIG